MAEGGITGNDTEIGRGRLWARVCSVALRAAGWRLLYQPPPGPKAVVIFYPHTSNWDFVLAMLVKGAIALPFSWAGKDSLFKGVFSRLFRALGGVPVNRREHTGFVGQMVKQFRLREAFYLGMAPEGTRSLTPGWKSGFYHLALEAHVPLALGVLDAGNKEIGVRGYYHLTGDEEQDMAAIAAAYRGVRGIRPELQSPIRLLSRDGDQNPAKARSSGR